MIFTGCCNDNGGGKERDRGDTEDGMTRLVVSDANSRDEDEEDDDEGGTELADALERVWTMVYTCLESVVSTVVVVYACSENKKGNEREESRQARERERKAQW